MVSARWWTLAVWALAAASALFWGLKIFAKPQPLSPGTQVAAAAGGAMRGDLSRLLGVDAPPPPVATAAEPAPDARFQLLGVVSPRASQASREGLALIAIDGKPAKAFRVGALVDGQNVLQAVGARGATLGPRDGAAAVALNLTPPPVAATGVLQSLSTQSGMPAQQGMPQQPMPQQPMLPPGQRRVLAPTQLPPGVASGSDVPGMQPPNQALQTQ